MSNLNTSPYYDDFDESKGFHQILFKPGHAIQARELTQLQSILRNQIDKFGSHIFKEGSVVIPGNSISDLSLCFVKLQTIGSVPILDLVGQEVVSSTGLKGMIKGSTLADGVDPDTIYVSYMNSGNNGERVFGNSEILTIGNVLDGEYNVTTALSGSTGGAGIAHINDGIFFVKGTFVKVNKQSVVISKYSNKPSCHVLLKINESIIDHNEDSTLLDTAQGSYNYAAPGADRLKISLELVTLPLTADISEDYIELMRYNEGVLEEHLRYSKYNELEKNLARRTYDESGDYVVEGLTVSAQEHLRSSVNGGKFTATQGGNIDQMVYNVTAGKAYIQGFENEKLADTSIIVNKARGVEHLATSHIAAGVSFGQYMYVTNLSDKFPDFSKPVTLTLFNTSSAGSSIGTATAISIDYLEPNTTLENAVFKIFLSRVSVATAVNIGRVTFPAIGGGTGSFRVLTKYTVSPNNAVDFVNDELVTFSSRTATVHKFERATNTLYVHKHSASAIPVTGDNITAPSGASARINASESLGKNQSDNLFIELSSSPTFSISNSSNLVDAVYKIYYTTTASINGSGVGSFSVTGMTIDPKELGNFLAVYTAGSTGVVPLANVTVATDGLSVSFAGCTPSTTIGIVCAATKIDSNASPKTKTLATKTDETVTSHPSNWIKLKKADGIQLVSIRTTPGNVNVTSRYNFSNGQTDYFYGRSMIRLKPGQKDPTGNLLVTYRYFNHNVGSGDYFCVDSYKDSGLSNYYINPILRFKSPNTGKILDLRELLDFRPRIGEDDTFTGIGSVNVSLPQVESRITTSVQSYVGRIDIVVIDKDNVIRNITGTPGRIPILPNIPDQSLPLVNIDVPPYTYSVVDISLQKVDNAGYTMKDIGKLEKRIENLEEYVTLTQTEADVVNYDIVDANTGLSRFKSGYLVDTFKNPDIISDVFNEKFKVTYVSDVIVPQFETVEAPLVITNNTGQITKGRVLTLPYTHEVMARQPVSSKITNVNPFAVFSWIGDLKITPSSDTWTETEYLPSIINNISQTVTIQRPWNWAPPAGANFTRLPAPAPVVAPVVAIRRRGRKVICAELHRQGLLTDELHRYDEEFGEWLYQNDRYVIIGYLLWASKVVNLMQKSPLLSKCIFRLALPWAKEIANRQGYGSGSIVGKAMMIVGMPICRMLGKLIHRENTCQQ